MPIVYIYLFHSHALFLSHVLTKILLAFGGDPLRSSFYFFPFPKCMYSQRVQPSFSVCQQVRISKGREWGEREGLFTSRRCQPSCFTGGGATR